MRRVVATTVGASAGAGAGAGAGAVAVESVDFGFLDADIGD